MNPLRIKISLLLSRKTNKCLDKAIQIQLSIFNRNTHRDSFEYKKLMFYIEWLKFKAEFYRAIDGIVIKSKPQPTYVHFKGTCDLCGKETLISKQNTYDDFSDSYVELDICNKCKLMSKDN